MAEKRPVKITETILRDAHQSLIATRMPTEEMLPIIDTMDKVGYHSVECWAKIKYKSAVGRGTVVTITLPNIKEAAHHE